MEALSHYNFLPISLQDIPLAVMPRFQANKLFLGHNATTLQVGMLPEDLAYDSRPLTTLNIFVTQSDTGEILIRTVLFDLSSMYDLITYPLPIEGSVPRRNPNATPTFITPGEIMHYMIRDRLTNEVTYLGFLDKPTQNLYLDSSILFSDD